MRCIRFTSRHSLRSSFALQIFLVALGLRLIPVLLTRQLSIGLDDMFQYDMLARSLASGNGFRWYAPADLARIAPYLHLNPADLSLDPRGMLTTFRAPLYPAFLSLVYSVNGINSGRFFAARLVQALLGALLAPLTYWVGLSIPFLASTTLVQGPIAPSPADDRSSRSAAWIVAAYPMLLIFPLALATENLFFLLALASVLAFLQLAKPAASTRIAVWAALAGLLLGLAALTRSVILPFGGLAILWIWRTLRHPRLAVIAALVMLATVAPWIIRNSLLDHKLTGIETSMGYNLYVGYHPQSTGTFTFGPSLDLLSVLDDKQRDEIGTQQAIGFIRADPGRFPYLAIRRLGYFFNLELRAFTYFYTNNFLGYIPLAALTFLLLLLALPFVVVSLSAAFGSALLARGPAAVLLMLLFVGYLLPHVFILSEERFHLTLIPFLAILAAGFWAGGPPKLLIPGRALIGVSVLIAVLLLLNWGLEIARDWPSILRMLGPQGNQLYLPY